MTTRARAPKMARPRQRPRFKSIDYDEVYTTSWDFDPITRTGSRKVTVTTTLTEAQIRASMTPEQVAEAEALERRFRGKRLVIINSTLRGGGVVIMRKPLIVLLQMMGVDVDWYVMAPNKAAFEFTKWVIHCGLQGTWGSLPISEAGIAIYLGWIAEEFEALREALAEADVFWCDDGQPSGLIAQVKRAGFKCKIIYRNHIQTRADLMATPGTPQFDVWAFMWWQCGISEADIMVTHPDPSFVPPFVLRRKVAFMPATVEPNDDLLRNLKKGELEREKAWLQHKFTAWGHSPIDWSRPYELVFARFDEAKFMEGALEYFARANQRLIDMGVPKKMRPQLVIAGNGATDDPSGRRVLRKIRKLVRTKYRHFMDDIHVARIPHRDLAINVLVRLAWICFQPSIAEGWESRVTDAIWLGVPVIGSTEGGIPQQILEGLSGFIRNPRAYDQWADIIVHLVMNPKVYRTLRRTTKEAAKSHNSRFTTANNAIAVLKLALVALEYPGYDLDQQWADSLDLPV